MAEVLLNSTSTTALLLGEKGGVGKSALAESLICEARWRGFSVAAFDADANVSSVYQKLAARDENGVPFPTQNPLEGVVRYNARSKEEADEVLNQLGIAAKLTFVDTPGGILTQFGQLLGNAEIDGFDEFANLIESMNGQLMAIHPITADEANIASQANVLNVFGTRARHLAVINRAFQTTPADLDRWTNSKTRRRLLQMGGREIYFPALQPTIFAHLKKNNYPLMGAPGGAGLKIADGTRLKLFQAIFRSEFDKVDDWFRS